MAKMAIPGYALSDKQLYTVIRFYDVLGDDVQALRRIVDAVRPGVFDGVDKGYPGRVSISISDDDSWGPHVNSIVHNVELLHDAIATTRLKNLRVEVDIAIEPEDYNSLLTEFVFDEKLLDALASRRIVLKICIYGSG